MLKKMSDQITSLTMMMKDITTNFTHKVKPVQTTCTDVNTCDKEISLLKEIFSIEDLEKSEIMKYLEIERSDDCENPSMLICTLCNSFLGLSKTNENSNRFSTKQGIQIAPTLLLSNLKDKELVKQREKFRTFKHSLKRHFDTSSHKNALKAALDMKIEEERIGARNEKVGYLCASTVYNNVYEAKSQKSYECDMACT